MPFLQDMLGLPSTRVPIDVTTLVWYILPPMVCQLAVAVLVTTPGQTRTLRVALFPIFALLILRAVTSVDASLGRPELKPLEGAFACAMTSLVIITLEWSVTEESLVRYLRPAGSTPSAIMDALDLVVNPRGHGWNWSHGVYIPRETRPTNHRLAFAFSTFLSALVHALSFAILSLLAQSFTNTGSRPAVIDPSLPFFARHLRASIITALSGLAGYATLQTVYDVCTIFGVLVLRQDPVQWPPAFDAPWLATSLHDFWGRRWHQWARHTFLLAAGYPLSMFFGRMGIVLGAFIASGILHDIFLVRIDESVSPWWELVGFGMMGPGLLIERAFYKMTGKRVGGALGWIWSMAWLLTFGSVMFEGFARAGVYNAGPADAVLLVPGWGRVESWVMDVDAWLRSV